MQGCGSARRHLGAPQRRDGEGALAWRTCAGEKASIWSFNYFFYNKKLKRILYFSCRAISKTSADEVRSLPACRAPPPERAAAGCAR